MRKSAKQTAPQDSACIRPEGRPIVGVAALLELARWGHRRRLETPGQSPCNATTIDQSPPPAASPGRRVRLNRLWGELPAQARHDTLAVLSRMVAQRLPTLPAKPEVSHENP